MRITSITVPLWLAGTLVLTATALPVQAEAPSDGLPEALSARLDLSAIRRELSFNDDLSGVSGYQLGGGFALAARLRWYPGAHASNGALAHLGLDLSAFGAPGLDTDAGQGRVVPSSLSGFSLGARVRVPLGRSELGFVTAYEAHDFVVSGGHAYTPERAPTVEYELLRLGADGVIALGEDTSLDLAAAFLLVLDMGPLKQAWFPNASGNGLDAEAGLSYALGGGFAVRGAVGMRRYFMSLEPEVGDEYEGLPIAGGAVDQYLRASLGLTWGWRG